MTPHLKQLIQQRLQIDRCIIDGLLTEYNRRTIVFTGVKAAYGWLGNMSAFPIEYNGNLHWTSEHLFQFLRFEKHPHIQALILKNPKPRLVRNPLKGAKRTARDNKKLLNRGAKWDEAEDDIPRMRLCLELKLEQHPKLKMWLLNTRDAELIEDCTARPRESALFWGKVFNEESGTWSGRNVLGTLWMDLRSELQVNPEKRFL